MKHIILLVLGFLVKMSFTQTTLDPQITGDTILCPNESGELTTTKAYETYQWFVRSYNDTSWSPFANGGNQRTISVMENHVLNYFKVEVTEGGNKEESNEVLLDQYAFLPPTVAHAGDFSTGSNGEAQFCAGDTMYFILNMPYDTNITWYRNSGILPKENDDTLLVQESGNYTVSGAPGLCPNFIVNLGLQIEVIKFIPKKPDLVQSEDSLLVINKDSLQSFTWYRNGSEITTNVGHYHLPVNSGNFYVRTTDVNGCESISDTISFNPSGVEDGVESKVNIFPNPVSNNLQIIIDKPTPVMVRIFDLNGRLMKQKTIMNSGQLDLSTLANGIHLVEIGLNGDVIRSKILKE